MNIDAIRRRYPAGEFRVYGAFCEWDSVMEAWVPHPDTEKEVLDMLG